MLTSPADPWDQLRQTFADQFEELGNGIIYRRSLGAEGIRVSADERNKFLNQFGQRIAYLKWIMYVSLTVVIGGIVGLSFLSGLDLSQAQIFGGGVVAVVPYWVYYRWAWAAPARELAGRTPVAGERSREEVRRLRYQHITYGQLAAAAFAGLVIPFIGSSGEIFAGWNRLWLVFGGALILLAGVQALRKWQTERGQEHSNVIRGQVAATREQIREPGASSKSKLWHYLPFAALLLALGFIGFTPAGKQLAETPSFWAVAMTGLAAWSLFTVAQGLRKGRIEPLMRGFHRTYQRETEPKRFWVSMAWNVIVGCFCFWVALSMSQEESTMDPTLSEKRIERESSGKSSHSVGGLFNGDDYPQDALDRNEEGSVHTKLYVGADGNVHGCTILKSSGSASLDRATCDILRKRARFTPAKDAAGQPTASEYVSPVITWRLED